MCSIMSYCGSGAAFDEFKKGFDRTISRGPMTVRLLIPVKVCSVFTVSQLWGWHLRECSHLNWTEVMLFAMASFMALKSKRKN